ncbi:hypothetical protein [Corynebacterium macginleyi]
MPISYDLSGVAAETDGQVFLALGASGVVIASTHGVSVSSLVLVGRRGAEVCWGVAMRVMVRLLAGVAFDGVLQ